MTFELFTSFFDTSDWLYKAVLVKGIPWFLSYITTAILIQQTDFIFYQINFWLCLICWVLSYVFTIERTISIKPDSDGNPTILKAENPFEDFLVALSAAWTIASVFITLGMIVFDYAKQPITNLNAIHSLLDIRLNLAIVLGVLIAIKSIVFVLQNKNVQLNQLFKSREQVTKLDEKLNPFLKGFSGFLNIAINLLGGIGNMLFKAFATIVVYLVYIGGEIYNSISSLVIKSVNLLFYLFQLIAVITAFHFANKTCLPLLKYLRESSWSVSYLPLIWVVVFSIIIATCMIAIIFFITINYKRDENKFERDIDQFNKSVARAMETLPYLIAVIWVAGVVLFLIAKIDLLHFTTFKIFGILSAILSSIVFVGFIIYLINNFKPTKVTSTATDHQQAEKENHTQKKYDRGKRNKGVHLGHLFKKKKQ
jgi:hypothetical protein